MDHAVFSYLSIGSRAGPLPTIISVDPSGKHQHPYPQNLKREAWGVENSEGLCILRPHGEYSAQSASNLLLVIAAHCFCTEHKVDKLLHLDELAHLDLLFARTRIRITGKATDGLKEQVIYRRGTKILTRLSSSWAWMWSGNSVMFTYQSNLSAVS